MIDHSSKETTLRDILKVLFRHKAIAVITFSTILLSVLLGLELRTPEFSAEVKMLVTGKMQKDVEYQRALGPGSLITTQQYLAYSKPIIERTVRALNLDKRPIDYEKRFASKLKGILLDHGYKKLKLDLQNMTSIQRERFLLENAMANLAGRISATPLGDTSIFVINVTDFSPATATAIANVVSRSYVIFDIEQQIAELQLTYGEKNETIIRLKKYIEKLEGSLDGRILPDIEAIGPASVKIVAQAGFGIKMPLRPSNSMAIIMALVLSIITSASLAYVFDYFDQTIKSSDDVMKFLKIPVLGSITERTSKDTILIEHTSSPSKYEQSIQKTSNQIYIMMKNSNLRSLVFVDSEGVSENAAIVANAGFYTAVKTDSKVLIIDLDLRSSGLSKLFAMSDEPGIADVLEQKVSLENAICELGSNLFILPAGQAVSNPTLLLELEAMRDVVRKSEELYEMIFINCPDINNFTDATILSSFINNFALIINEGHVKRQIVKHLIEPLEQKNSNIKGVILYNCKHVIPEIIYKLT